MSWEVGHPLRRDGTSQAQRSLEALDPGYVPIDPRSEAELLAFLYRLSKQFVYYNFNNEAEGSWEEFFPLEDWLIEGEVSLSSIQRYLDQQDHRQDEQTFLAIIRAFLHLYRYLQDDINQLSTTHLRFYYEKVLGFRPKAARADELHILFELNKNASTQRIPAGTEIQAGRDALGKTRYYLTQEEIIVNHAKLAATQTILLEPDGQIFVSHDPHLSGEAWAPFGDKSQMETSTAGFAIASHLLSLAEGKRTITLSLSFENIPDALGRPELNSLTAEASSKEGWIAIRPVVTISENNQLIFILELAPDQAAIEKVMRKDIPDIMTEDLPVLAIKIRPGSRTYHAFSILRLTGIHLRVGVEGLQADTLYNDLGQLDANSSFLPFGAEPFRGAQFEIGSREAFSKPLESLDLQFQWGALPDGGLRNLYADPYPEQYRNISNYSVNTQVLLAGNWENGASQSLPLFRGNGSSSAALTTIPVPIRGLELRNDLPESIERGPGIVQGFLRLVLNQDFGHERFTGLFADFAKSTEGPNPRPNQPYTPNVQSLSLSYTASQEYLSEDLDERLQFFHIGALGRRQISAASSLSLFPSLSRGSLFLGIRELSPPQNLHLLFQAQEGSNLSGEIIRDRDISWSYWTGEGWKAFPETSIFINTTLGLQIAGIIAFSLGPDASDEGGPLPEKLFWLQANIQTEPDAANRLVQIHTQAVRAVFQDRNNDPSHTSTPLEPKQANRLSINNRALKRIQQPYPSRHGRGPEQDLQFFSRISERLRHKQRAITLWDMEHLVLNEFPEVYKVKVIPHTRLRPDGSYSEFQAGHCCLVIIPDQKKQLARNSVQAIASNALLSQIEQYLKPYISHFAKIHLINPRYEEIRLRFSVGFREGYDRAYYQEVLNEDIRRHLSPWAYEEGVEISFGGEVYQSQLLAFVENRPYVDYITDFYMDHRGAGPGVDEACIELDLWVYGPEGYIQTEIARASTQASILVSASQHEIHVLAPGEYPCEGPSICPGGIDCWYIEIDNIVS